MRTINRSHPPAVISAKTGRRPSRDRHPSAPSVRPQLIADGVVAGYIHDISTRHRGSDESEVAAYEFATEAEAA